MRCLRTARGMTQEKLAECCDLDRTYISLIERGRRSPTLHTVVRLCNVLEVDLPELCKLILNNYNG